MNKTEIFEVLREHSVVSTAKSALNTSKTLPLRKLARQLQKCEDSIQFASLEGSTNVNVDIVENALECGEFLAESGYLVTATGNGLLIDWSNG